MYKKVVTKYQIVAEPTQTQAVKIKSSLDLSNFVKDIYSSDIYLTERFYAIFLNRAQKVTGYALISSGGLVGTVVDLRILMKYAINILCTGMIVVHNHPSGNTQPSTEDKRLTAKIKEACNALDITLLDHVIVTGDSYYSFADNGKL